MRKSLISALWVAGVISLVTDSLEAEVQQYLVNSGMTEAAAWITPNGNARGTPYGPVGEFSTEQLHWNLTQYLAPADELPWLPGTTNFQGPSIDGIWSVATPYMKAERFLVFRDYFFGFRLDSRAPVFGCNEEDLGIQANEETSKIAPGLIPFSRRKTLDQMTALAFSLATLVRAAVNGTKCTAAEYYNRGRTSLVLSFKQENGSRSLIYWLTLYDSKDIHHHSFYCDTCFSDTIWQVEDDIDILGYPRPQPGGPVQNYGYVDVLPRLRSLITKNPYYRRGVSRNPADYRLIGVALGVTTFGDALIDSGFAHLTIRDVVEDFDGGHVPVPK